MKSRELAVPTLGKMLLYRRQDIYSDSDSFSMRSPDNTLPKLISGHCIRAVHSDLMKIACYSINRDPQYVRVKRYSVLAYSVSKIRG